MTLLCVRRVSVRKSAPIRVCDTKPGVLFYSLSMLAEIEQAAKVLPSDQKERLVASLLAGLRKEGISKVTGDKAARASLLPLAATAWSQDWDTAEEDEAWRDL